MVDDGKGVNEQWWSVRILIFCRGHTHRSTERSSVDLFYLSVLLVILVFSPSAKPIIAQVFQLQSINLLSLYVSTWIELCTFSDADHPLSACMLCRSCTKEQYYSLLVRRTPPTPSCSTFPILQLPNKDTKSLFQNHDQLIMSFEKWLLN